ncbi:MAG: DUF3037 domain-containing protein [Pyrinomonadaceae bacterium]
MRRASLWRRRSAVAQVPELCTFDYAVVRVVPRVEREEFINAGVILSCPDQRFLEARIDLNRARLLALDSSLDADEIERFLQVIPIICHGGAQAGPIGQLPQRSRFHWLVAPRSTIIQMSPVHTGLCAEPEAMLERLLDGTVRIINHHRT